jgi:hypothetical protein
MSKRKGLYGWEWLALGLCTGFLLVSAAPELLHKFRVATGIANISVLKGATASEPSAGVTLPDAYEQASHASPDGLPRLLLTADDTKAVLHVQELVSRLPAGRRNTCQPELREAGLCE